MIVDIYQLKITLKGNRPPHLAPRVGDSKYDASTVTWDHSDQYGLGVLSFVWL